MNVILTINTTERDESYVSLQYDGKKKEKKTLSVVQKAQTVLPLIVQILKENNMSLTDIQEIRVIDTHGSLTGTRVGFAIANTLGYVLDIPVNGTTPPATPQYDDKWSQ